MAVASNHGRGVFDCHALVAHPLPERDHAANRGQAVWYRGGSQTGYVPCFEDSAVNGAVSRGGMN